MIHSSIKIQVELSVQDARERLYSEIVEGQFRSRSSFFSKTLVGFVKGDNIRAWRTPNLIAALMRRYSPRVEFCGKLSSEGNGTVLEGYFDIAPPKLEILLGIFYVVILSLGTFWCILKREYLPCALFVVIPFIWLSVISDWLRRLKQPKKDVNHITGELKRILTTDVK